MGKMQSLYAGKCATCAKPIKAGEWIDYRGKTGGTHHWTCVSPVIEWELEDAHALADKLMFLPCLVKIPKGNPRKN